MRYASGALVVYDISNKQTFENVKNWIDDLPGLTKNDTVVMIVGNKKDIIDNDSSARQVSTQELSTLARDRNCLYKETSSYYSYQSIEETFIELIRGIQL